MKKLAAAIVSSLCIFAAGAQVPGYEVQKDEDGVSFVRADGTAAASLRIMAPVLTLNTTKSYAQYVMDRYRGWELKPVIDLRGFAFKYVDNAPCSGLLTYFDGRSYLLFTSCGLTDENELEALFRQADKELRISETLKREAHPNLY